MYSVVKGVEESGWALLVGHALGVFGVSSDSPVWSGIFSGMASRGFSPFKSGFLSGYATSLASRKEGLKRGVIGGAFGVGTSLFSRLVHKTVPMLKR